MRIRVRAANSSRTNRRNGYVYVSVLTTATIVSVVGFSALMYARVSLKQTESHHNALEAQLLARAATEEALRRINADPTWRTSWSNNVEYPATPLPLGSGTISWKLVDNDGDLADDDGDAVTIHGIGRVGEAVFVERVVVEPTGTPLSCLESNLHCNGDITVGFIIDLITNQSISSNGSIQAVEFQASVQGDAEAVGSITGEITGNRTSGAPARQMPSSTALGYYRRNGTHIGINSLPSTGANSHGLEQIVLSPASNPYGSETNAEGIYVIDCQGKELIIRNCRIVGTLVVLNPADTSRVEFDIHWVPAVANYPCLLVDGDMELHYSDGTLSESLLATNFNPPGTPFEGESDADTSDGYPSTLQGLLYVSGTLEIPSNGIDRIFEGVIVTGQVSINADTKLRYNPIYHYVPPPGFARGNVMRVSQRSRARAVLAP